MTEAALLERLNQVAPTEYAHAPSMFSIEVPNVGEVLITKGHNIDGWEAVLDNHGDQSELPDGPPADATDREVVNWVAFLVDILQ